MQHRPAFLRGRAAWLAGMLMMCATAFAAPASGAANVWPERPLRFIVPFPPGGPTDSFVRTVAGPLGEALGQNVVVENRAGAGGTIGIEAVARAAPDGYTLGLGSAGALMALPHLTKVPYSVTQDLAYVSSLAQVPAVIAVNPATGIADMQQLLARAKSEPGKLNYASAGTGTLVHLLGELFKRETGADIVHVPYKGAAPAISDLLGGQVESIVSDLTPLVPHVAAGKVKVLAVTSAERTDVLPDVPTMAELGYPNVLLTTEYGVIMPAGTPQAIVDKVQAALAQVLKSPEVKQTYARMGAVPAPSTSAQYRQNVLTSYEYWGRFIKQAGITID